jgi:hypothetical protein
MLLPKKPSNKQRLGATLRAIDELMRGGVEDNSREHDHRLRSIATQIKLMGGKIKGESLDERVSTGSRGRRNAAGRL